MGRKKPRYPGGDRSEARNNDAEIVQFLSVFVNRIRLQLPQTLRMLARRLRRIRGAGCWLEVVA